MNRIIRDKGRATNRRRMALIAVPLLLSAVYGCQEIDSDGEANAILRISVAGLGERTVEFEVPAGVYTIEANGSADDTNSTIDVQLIDNGTGDPAAGTTLVIPNADTGGQNGDTGFGSVSVSPAPGETLDVVIPFGWHGITPESALNIGIEFGRAPDIFAWTVTPSPNVNPGALLAIELDVQNNTGPPTDLVCGADLGVVFQSLVWDPDLMLFVGNINAPLVPGPYTLGVTVEDTEGHQTATDKQITVGPLAD